MHVDTFIHRRSEFVTRNIIFGHFVLLCKAELSGGVFFAQWVCKIRCKTCLGAPKCSSFRIILEDFTFMKKDIPPPCYILHLWPSLDLGQGRGRGFGWRNSFLCVCVCAKKKQQNLFINSISFQNVFLQPRAQDVIIVYFITRLFDTDISKLPSMCIMSHVNRPALFSILIGQNVSL